MNKTSLWLLVVLLFSFYSCKKKNTSASREKMMISEIIKNDIHFDYFSAKSKIRFDDGKKSLASTVSIKIHKGNQVWTSFLPLLGIEALRAKAVADSVFVLNRLEKSYSESSYQLINQQFGIESNYKVLEALIMGDVPVKDLDQVKLSETNEYFILSQKINGFTVENKIDKKLKRVKELFVFDGKGSELKAIYSDFVDLEGQQFAKNVSIAIKKINEDPISAEINHGRIKKSSSPLKFPFNKPKSYSRKEYGNQ